MRPHPIPLPEGRTVWSQANAPRAEPTHIAPFPLNTTQTFAHMRVEGTPHNWTDAQAAWDQGRMASWPAAKRAHSMGYYTPAARPFQYALADAFTICDAYHCSMQVGTNTNRLFLFTGTHDPLGKGGGPSLSNSHDSLPEKGGPKDAYTWTTYPERLQAAGVSWRVYQDMADNFGDNPLEGFAAYRASKAGAQGADPALAAEGLSTHTLDRLRADVLADALPQVCHIVAPAIASEHPGPSSPAQGADYTAQVLDALTANPKVWAKTVLLLMFDENDGFFDHVPPPAPPSRDATGALLGGSTVDLTGEHHLRPQPAQSSMDVPMYVGRPYGLGPRVPMYAISPWSRGGWANSQVFDHTSVIRFLEARFGVMEPNISPCAAPSVAILPPASTSGRLVGGKPPTLPATRETAARARAMRRPHGPRRRQPSSRPCRRRACAPPGRCPMCWRRPHAGCRSLAHVRFTNRGDAGAVFHVYDLKDLRAARRAGTRWVRSTTWGPRFRSAARPVICGCWGRPVSTATSGAAPVRRSA